MKNLTWQARSGLCHVRDSSHIISIWLLPSVRFTTHCKCLAVRVSVSLQGCLDNCAITLPCRRGSSYLVFQYRWSSNFESTQRIKSFQFEFDFFVELISCNKSIWPLSHMTKASLFIMYDISVIIWPFSHMKKFRLLIMCDISISIQAFAMS